MEKEKETREKHRHREKEKKEGYRGEGGRWAGGKVGRRRRGARG